MRRSGIGRQAGENDMGLPLLACPLAGRERGRTPTQAQADTCWKRSRAGCEPGLAGPAWSPSCEAFSGRSLEASDGPHWSQAGPKWNQPKPLHVDAWVGPCFDMV